MAMNEGNRNYSRVKKDFNVRLVHQCGASRRSIVEINSSRAINVSGNGLLVNTSEKLDAGMILNVTFMKPNTLDFFKGKGKIVRVERIHDGTYNIGINFLDLSREDMSKLDYYITMR
jgi:hypothetical protein